MKKKKRSKKKEKWERKKEADLKCFQIYNNISNHDCVNLKDTCMYSMHLMAMTWREKLVWMRVVSILKSKREREKSSFYFSYRSRIKRRRKEEEA